MAQTIINPLLTLRTERLVGRQPEYDRLVQAREALGAAGAATLLMYITGSGGMGKTRLLESIRDGQHGDTVLTTGIIDFYDADTHGELGLMEKIADSLCRRNSGQVGDAFEDYRQLMQQFRTQQTAGIGELEHIRDLIARAFIAAWRRIAEHFFILVLLDTAELLQYQQDDVQEAFKLGLSAAASKDWLTRVVRESALPRTLFIVAGRPEPPALFDEFRALATPARFVQLGGLDADGVRDYIDALAGALQEAGCADDATRVEELTPDLRRAIGELTEGLPVSLAIAIHLYLTDAGREFAPLLEQPDIDRAAARQTLRQALVRGLVYYAFGDVSEPLQYLALMRKGMTADRLAAIWPGHSRDECQEALAFLRRQTFIKARPDGSLVLHDEIADWIEHGLFAGNPARSREVYRRIGQAYHQEFDGLQDKIEILNRQSDIHDEETDEQAARAPQHLELTPEQLSLERELRECRLARRQVAIDRMYYALRHDPIGGFKQYYELAEEAFGVDSREYDAQVRTEFLHWWNEKAYPDRVRFQNRGEAERRGLSSREVNADLAVRWVQRQYNREQRNKAHTAALIRRFLDSETLALSERSRLILQLYLATALGQSQPTDEQAEEIRAMFNEGIHRLELALASAGDPGSLEVFVQQAGLAFGYYELGFFERNLGNYSVAIQCYARSIWDYRGLGLEISQARSLNDRAYALGLVGDSEQAELSVDDALALRKRLGFGRLIALSLNTKGMIATLDERPADAIHHCRRALQIFRRIGDEWGEMLALRSYAEALRRDSERVPTSLRKNGDRLRQACAHSLASVKIARRIQPAKSEALSEALDECGSAYRDLARYCHDNPAFCELGEGSGAEAQAEQLLLAAVEAVPAGRSYVHRWVDSMINLAYLYYYAGRETEAREAIAAVLERIPASLRNPGHPGHLKEIQGRSVYWGYLAKAHALSLRMAGSDEAELLHACIRVLYFASLIGDDMHRIRSAREVVYRQLKSRSSETHQRMRAQAEAASADLGIPPRERDLLRKYLEGTFGAR